MLAERIIYFTSSCYPLRAEIRHEEWLATLDELPGNQEKLYFALTTLASTIQAQCAYQYTQLITKISRHYNLPLTPDKTTVPTLGGIMNKGNMLYEGKAKKVFATENPAEYIVEFKDDATAFDAKKRGGWAGKGFTNNAITSHLFPLLEAAGIPTHFIEKLDDGHQRVKAVKIVPVEVIVRNVAAGTFSQRLGIPEGTALACPVVEYSYKFDELSDPIINTDTAIALGWATANDLKTMRELALKVRELLVSYFAKRGVKLVDFKLEFGKLPNGDIILADEISPDTARFWDEATGEKLDKDRFRRDLGGEAEAYAEMLKRVTQQA